MSAIRQTIRMWFYLLGLTLGWAALTAWSAIERYEEPAAGSLVMSDREWANLEKQAGVLAKSQLVRKNLRGKPNDILAIAMTAHSMGLPVDLNTLNQFAVIEGQAVPSGQILAGIAARSGHDVWLEDESEQGVTACLQRRGSQRVHRRRYTIEEAKTSGALDYWYQRWTGPEGEKRKERIVVDKDGKPVDGSKLPDWCKGEPQSNPAWHQHPTSMLGWRALRRVLKIGAPEALTGLAVFMVDEPATAPALEVDEETGEVLGGGERPQDPADPAPAASTEDPSDGDEDIVDAELVAQEEAGPVRGSAGTDAPPGPRVSAGELEHLLARIADLPDDWWRQHLKGLWHRRVPSLKGDQFTEEHLPEAHKLIDEVEAEIKRVDDERRKHANAVMSNIGIRGDEERHAFVHAATDGATSSTKGLTGPQLKQIVEACEKYGTTGPSDEQPAIEFAEGEEPF